MTTEGQGLRVVSSSAWRRYALAAAFTAGALALRLAFSPILGSLQPFAFFYVAVACAAWWGGLGPAVVACLGGLVAGLFFFVDPRFTLSAKTLAPMLTYLAVSSCFIALLRRARVSERRAIENSIHTSSAESELKQRNALLNGLAESVLDGILIVSDEGRLLYANEQFKRIWNFPPEVLSAASDEVALNWAEQQTANPAEFREGVVAAYGRPNAVVRGELLMKDGRVLDRFGSAIIRNGVQYGWVWTFRDITNLKKAEFEAEGERARLEAVLEACPAGVVVADATGKVLRRNVANQRLWGPAPMAESIDDYARWKGWWSDGEPVGAHEWALARAVRGDVVLGDLVEIEPFDAPGTRRTIINSGAPVRDRSGRVIGGVSAQIDITDLKRAERALRESSERMHRIVNSAMDAVISIDEDQRIVLFNSAAEQMFGCSTEEALGESLDRFIPPHFRKDHAGHVRNFGKTGVTSRAMGRLGTLTALRVSGDEFPIEASISQVEVAGRKMYTVILRDITERKRADDSLRESEERFRAMADNIAQLAWMADAEGNLFWYNKRWFEYTGTTMEQMKGWGWINVHHPDHLDRVTRHWKESLRRGDRWEDVFPLRRHDGRWGWFLSIASPIRDETGRITRWFGTNTDITELRETQDALHAAQEELQRHTVELEKTVEERTAALRESYTQLETFSYSITHDLRAPLRTMSSFATLLQEEYGSKLDADGRAYLERIINAAARMDVLIRDVLQYSRVTTSNVALERVDLPKLMREVVLQYPNLAEHQDRIRIQNSCEHAWVMANPAALTQVIANLVSNALKFVPPDRTPDVQLSCEQEDGRVRLTVADNGVGIAPEHRDKIFGLFQRLHSQQEYSGSGVGLAIVKKAVERMGGTIGVESEVGVGSRFSIELLLADQRQDAPAPSTSSS